MSKLVAPIGLAFLLASTAVVAAAPGGKAKNPPSSPGPQYCITFEPSTGSHVSKTVCRTKAEWAELGVDVDDATKK